MASSYQPHPPPHLLADYIISAIQERGKTVAESYCDVGNNKQYYYNYYYYY